MRASDAGRPQGLIGRLGRRAAVAALVAGVPVAVPVSVPGTGVTAGTGRAEAASSWDSRRTEEFTKDGLPKGCDTYGGPYQGGKSYWNKDGVRIADGLLRLRLLRKTGAPGYPFTSGGVGCWNSAQTFGRYEVRAKVPVGKGIDSYITLMPSKGGEQSWTGIELLAPGPETAYITNGFGTGTETARVPGTYSNGFHTYVIEWAPNLVQISVDNAVVYSSTKSYRGKRWLGLVVSNGDALTGVPDAATKLPAEFEIDYLKTATFTGVAPVARATTPPVSRSRPVASASPAPTGTGLKAPPTTPAAVAETATETEAADSALAGGVWPWLLGGSMIAGLAVVSLSYPRGRRDAPAGDRRRRGRGRVRPGPQTAPPAPPAPPAPTEPPAPTGRDTGEFERPQVPVR
jgi:beta-glucanase (GH16 family)